MTFTYNKNLTFTERSPFTTSHTAYLSVYLKQLWKEVGTGAGDTTNLRIKIWYKVETCTSSAPS